MEETREKGPVSYVSIHGLVKHTKGCSFPKADIVVPSKRLRDGDDLAFPQAGDVAGLKVEKNALALVFIPQVAERAFAMLDAHADSVFIHQSGPLTHLPVERARAVLDARHLQSHVCLIVYNSIQAVFEQATREDFEQVAAVPSLEADLLLRYQRALTGYHTHTQVADTHFNPRGHILAGINTALFFILRALSAMCVLGQRHFDRPISRAELEAMVENTSPLLLALARCHLQQLLDIEIPLGKGDDLFMMRCDQAEYDERIAAMFRLGECKTGGESKTGLRLEIAPDLLSQLPLSESVKPRTGCPALYAATQDGTNVIVALIHATARSFADLMFGLK